MKNPPCKDCSTRHLACHGSCEIYLEWKSYNDKRKEDNMKRSEVAGALYESNSRRMRSFKYERRRR